MDVFLLYPQTFMNLSGEAVAKALKDLPIPFHHVLVVHDDIDISLGQFRFKEGGGEAGHKGLISISGRLGSKDYHRLRIGIGPRPTGDIATFVLQRFSNVEQSVILRHFQDISNGLDTWLERGIAEAMNQFNGQEATPAEKKEKD